jgi:hypothetical protein
MKRREFLFRSVGTVGASLVPALAFSQTRPCPVTTLRVDSGPDVTTACTPDNSSLAGSCSALSSGQSRDFSNGAQSSFSQADVEWESAFYHDDAHGLVHLMGKPANQDQGWKHQYFDVSTDRWTVVGSGMWDNPGHIYGNFTMDFATGDCYVTRGGADYPSGRDFARRARCWKYSQKGQGSGAWNNTAPVGADYWIGGDNSFVSHMNGVTYHPHLYGQNDGGLIVDSQFVTIFWRKSTDGVQRVSHSGDAYGDLEGAGVYWPARNIALVGGSHGHNLARVTPNGTGTPTVQNAGRPPISTGGHGGGTGFGSLHVHPGNPQKLLLLETYGSRAFTTTDGSSWTQIGSHPFSFEGRVLCSLRGGLGCMWAIGASRSVLWRPPV